MMTAVLMAALAWGGQDDKAVDDALEAFKAAMKSTSEADRVTAVNELAKVPHAKTLARLAPLHVEFTDKIRDAFVTYFATVKALKVEFADLDIDVAGDEALATFTRRDDFTDARTGSPVHFEVRLSSIMSKQDGQWRIRGLKKSA